MEEQSSANESISKLKDVRIVYLPPATVASICCVGGNGGEPEHESGNLVHQFIRDHHLDKVKPDFRHYGFNHPNGSLADGSDHGYERWVTIPETMEVALPYVKKEFSGGLYAAHMIPMGAFEEWEWLCNWAMANDQYEPNWGDTACMGGLLEEHLDYIHKFMLNEEKLDENMQLDLLFPIKEKVES